MDNKRDLVAAAALLGTFETVSQVVLVRELLIAFTGNELTMAIVLSVWLISVAAGCAAARGITPRGVHARVAALFIMAGTFSLVQVILIRLARPALAPAGELLSPALTVALAALGVAPCALLFGALFVGLIRYGEARSSGSLVPTVYGGEALGSGFAGAVLSLWLLEAADPMGVTAAGALFAGAAAVLVLRSAPAGRRRAGSVGAAALLASAALVLAYAGRIDLRLRDLEWRPLHVVASVDTKYGNVVVTERDGLHDFYRTGSLAFTIPDPMYAEETVHIPLLYHPGPRRVLLIGGGGSGVVAEALKHPSVERVDFVELDPAVLTLAERYGPPGRMGGDGRDVRAVLGDGRSYVAATDEKYDVIIVAAGPPISLQVNRLYTEEFFALAGRALLQGGLVGLTVEAPGARVGDDLAGLISSLVNALKPVFGHVELLPGETIHVLASDAPLAEGKYRLIPRLAERGIETAYINEFFLADRLSPLRADQLDRAVALRADVAPNSDARPVTFSYALTIWAKHFRSGKALARVVSHLGPAAAVAMLAAIAAVAVAVCALAWRLGRRGAAPLAALYSTGFTTMFTTVLIMLCFQITRGYVYTRLAVIIAAFMTALGLTATLGGRRLARSAGRAALLLTGTALVCLPVIVAVVFARLQHSAPGPPGAAVDVLYVVLAALAGVIGAGAFTVASASLAKGAASEASAGAAAYSMDLVGASVAGFTTGFLTIPALGITAAALAVAAVNLGVLCLLAFATGRSPSPAAR